MTVEFFPDRSCRLACRPVRAANATLRWQTVLLSLCAVVHIAAATPACADNARREDAESKQLDIVISGGRVIDPESGLDGIRHVGIRGDRIVTVSEASLDHRLVPGGAFIEAAGLIVAPGFIDLHAHGQDSRAHEFQARDGVTTALELEWGSPEVEAFLTAREGRSLVNFGVSASHGLIRSLVMPDIGNSERLRMEFRVSVANDDPLKAIEGQGSQWFYKPLPEAAFDELFDELDQALTEGALGIGMAHQYYPGATRNEIFRVFQYAAARRVPIFTHVRSMTIDAMQEVIADAAATGAHLHIVHVNSMSLGKIATVLDLIDGARRHGTDVSTEAYPYTAASTSIDSAIFDQGWQDRLGITYHDLQWEETGERLSPATYEQYRGTGGNVIIHMMHDDWIDLAVKTPWVMIASDGMPYAPGAHPRTAGTFSRVLGHYVRERGLLDLPVAIAKLTLLPARRLENTAPQMARKGRIQAGSDADITIFDAAKVIDTSTFEGDLSFSRGIVHVIVNGSPVVSNGHTVEGNFPGRAIRGIANSIGPGESRN